MCFVRISPPSRRHSFNPHLVILLSLFVSLADLSRYCVLTSSLTSEIIIELDCGFLLGYKRLLANVCRDNFMLFVF
jgi:hypothetical protein